MKTITHHFAHPHPPIADDPPGSGVAIPWLPGEMMARRAVHELLYEQGLANPSPFYPALRMAQNALGAGEQAIVWCDPHRTFYPPAFKLAGLSLDRLCILQPRQSELVWTIAECLRCPGVAVVAATLPLRLTRVEARRLQLAAERGGGVGILMRPVHLADIYAAASRWLVSPTPGERGVQRFKIEPFHGHGRYFGQSFILENRRAFANLSTVDPLPLHPSAALVHCAPASPAARTSA